MSGSAFDQVAYAGPETGVKDRVSYSSSRTSCASRSPQVCLPDDEIARHVALHGDGVKDIAILVEDTQAAFDAAIQGGAHAVLAPTVLQDDSGTIVKATISTYGETVHSFVQRDAYQGIFMPGYVEARRSIAHVRKPALQFIDHCVGNVGWGEMDAWGDFYARVFGFSQLVSFDDKDISTEFTALRSKVMTDSRHRVKFPINEPAQGKKKSQIEEYLDFLPRRGRAAHGDPYRGYRCDHRSAASQRRRVSRHADSYYDLLEERVGKIDEAMETLRRLRILVDRDDQGYMLQIFTKPLQDRPTVFFEIIQRKGSLSFGKGNFKALFVSIEREQRARHAVTGRAG